MRILVDQAVIMRHQGVCAKEIVAMLEKLKQRVTIYAGLDTLEYLYKGGRISRTEANLGKLINIKPVLTFTTDGSVVLCGKQVGFRHVFKQVLRSWKPRRRIGFTLFTSFTPAIRRIA